ncbi:HEPN domain-containing protein [Aeromonas enteropelogenes]|uniref:HEPN domain-containing protein n=1 Tax=Aeromonas enteropelogenes TaxID=29489 RepID=UPI001628D439|nr:HEPN domain-containing protein [Aeromonas enteropelogenes]
MIITNLNTWTYEESMEGLLFFAQRILELSYDKTDFSEKRVSVSALDIVNECLEYINLEERGLFNVSNLELGSLFAELKDAIRSSKTIKGVLGDKLEYYLSKLNVDTDKKVTKNVLEILRMKLRSGDYYSLLKRDLKDCIVNFRKKDELHNITTSFYQFLLSYGYQKGTIYYLTNKHFFDRTGVNEIVSINDLDGFTSLFDLEKKNFEVVFTASNLFLEIKDSCKKFKLELNEEKEPLYNDALESKFYRNLKKKKLFISCKDIRAVDYQHAMRKAKERVSLLLGLFVVFSHRNRPWVSDYCLVYKHDKHNVVHISKQGNAMHSLGEQELSYTKEIFPIFISQFGLQTESFQRFNRCVELHSHALDTDEVASQIVNLWICLETLLITNKTNSHIGRVVDTVSLINSFYAVRKRVSSLTDLLIKWNKEEFENAKNKIGISDNEKATAALVGVEEFKPIAVELLDLMVDQPLLRYKFFLLVRDMQTKSGVKKFLEKEDVRCKRDINRAYRSRNKIVHQGNISDHEDYLVETIHHYLDLMLFAIIERKVSFNDIRTIDNLIQEMRINVECHNSFLSGNQKNKITKEEFVNILFGPQN